MTKAGSVGMKRIAALWLVVSAPDRQQARDQADQERLAELTRAKTFAEAHLGHALIRDSQNGNAVAKLDRRQSALERSFYQALDQLQRLRARHQ